MIKDIRTGLAFAGTLVVLIVSVALFTHFGALGTTDFNMTDLKSTLLPWRVAMYVLVVAAWKPISRFLSRPRVYPEDRTEEMLEKWDHLSDLLARSWWKVALFFAAFEVIIIQQVGMGA
ncbi:hypothetical protein [Marinobacterium weihaiense]|uniref:Uncharacterized protein n=1 Tax=Marinobacterium weihaiense TaxID=2851016 RepID=A0ABS6MD09_9GAMM|nr:hypothetical protein [Marinobacterium weihaiense]MBV0934178.1 hypothetical protein [Marinobacterium weihaiense]